jgi:hypothetical protein
MILKVRDEDTFNLNAYRLDDTFASNDVSMEQYVSTVNGALVAQLYSKSPEGTDGKYTFTEVKDANTPIHSSVELYFKKLNADDSYVNIYSLVHAPLKNFPELPYWDSGFRIAGLLYAMASLRKRRLLLYLADTQSLNNEQGKILAHFSELAAKISDLQTTDYTGYESEADREKFLPKWSPPLDLVAFMVERNLLTSDSSIGQLSKDFIAKIKAYLEKPSTESKAAAEKAAAGIQLRREKLLLLNDILRAYGDQVSGNVTESIAMFQMEMQYFQQDTTTASGLLGRVENLKSDTLGNIR